MRHPSSTKPRNSVATITNGVAMPSSNTKRRSAKPTTTVGNQIAMPVRKLCGARHARLPIQATARAIKNGAATDNTPLIAVPSSWLRLPIATNASTLTASITNARATTARITLF